MIREFEGKTEKEAIDQAVVDLGLERDEFDVEIVESEGGFLFKKGKVKIRVHVSDEEYQPLLEPEGDFEQEVATYIETLITKMGYSGRVSVLKREDGKIVFDIESRDTGVLIGRKGRNLDAIQLLANVYAGNRTKDRVRVVVDAENYRTRREESLVRLAHKTADQVRRSRSSTLLEPM
ncbi:MAG: KH domain-containing protein, partial [Spirochaetales bacterium]|nr:KH domain-containing protein [Spirochaetales bacterium]MCF7939872.1 KH domain-containing protein [Spirochaetales bacterium]